MPTQLQGLHARFTWFSYLGALGGCLDYLGLPIPPGWLYGGTGLAFAMNMAADVDPVEFVTWDDAQAYCQWPALRLPWLVYRVTSASREAMGLAFGMRSAPGFHCAISREVLGR